jgi:taurine dioxygenase
MAAATASRMQEGQACGPRVTGVDLRAPLEAAMVAEIRAAWLRRQV